MNRKHRVSLLFASALAFAGWSLAAVTPIANTSNATMALNFEVTAAQTTSTCSVSAPTLNLNHASGSAPNSGTSGTIVVACNNSESTPFTLTVDNGEHPLGTLRRAKHTVSDAFLNYTLTSSTPPVNGAELTSVSGSTTVTSPTSSQATIAVTARVIAGQTLATGTYTDSLVVTLTY